jgi:hypothetical protein
MLGVHQRRVVDDGVDAGEGAIELDRLADVGADEVDVGAVRLAAMLEDGDAIAATAQRIDERAADEAATAGHQGVLFLHKRFSPVRESTYQFAECRLRK